MVGPRILVVEDDAFKLERISACLNRLPMQPAVTVVMSVQKAVAALECGVFDLILLDMALPSHQSRPGGGTVTSMLSGGMEVIMELAFLHRDERVIIITQYPEVEIEGELVPLHRVAASIKSICTVNIAGVIHYEHDEKSWEDILVRTAG